MRTVIVGSGPSASSTAISLLSLRKDADVIILGNNLRMNPVKCGGAISRFLLEKCGLSVPDNLVGSPIQRTRLLSPNGNFWELNCEEIGLDQMGYVLHRSLFDQWLLKKAVQLGAQIHEKKVTKPDLRNISYDVLVGADGVNSTVAKFVKRPKLELRDIHHGVQLTTRWKDHPDGLIDLYFGNKVAPHGYAWVFPCGKDVRIGVGIPLSLKKNPAQYLKRFLNQIEAPNDGEFISKLIPTAKPPRTGVYGNTLLVGDALPGCDPATGGGIANAIFGGLAAGKAIAENNLKKYDGYWKKRFYLRNRIRYTLKKMLCLLSDQDFNQLISTLKTFKIKSPSIGREMGRALLYMAVRQPSLFLSKLPQLA